MSLGIFWCSSPLRFSLVVFLIVVGIASTYAQGRKSQNGEAILEQPTGDGEDAVSTPERDTYEFDRDWLVSHARELAKEEFKPKEIEEDSPLNELSYDQYKAIEFQRGATIWAKEDRNFRLGLLHPGFLYKTPVKLNLVVAGTSREILYTPKIFNYGNDSNIVKNTEAKGYSGFRVNTPINKEGVWDEILVFQGGSYFRALGKNNWYGLSARGLAINTAMPSGEEFPAFTEFWIERPSKSSEQLKIHALLESQSVTGAYTYTVNPGNDTVIDVKSNIFPRRDVPHYGLAPLTSMFLFDGTNRSRFDDFRPAVHDTNGLLMLKNNGEKIWRPLANPVRLQKSSFMDTDLKGFGLMQRSRDFEDFEDVEAHYQHRPSVWIEPTGNWGEGHVELVEIPSDREFNDNIVAYWQPKEALKKGQEYQFDYRMLWGMQPSEIGREGRVINSRSGRAVYEENVREFFVDYKADEIPSDLKVNVETSKGKIIDSRGLMANGNYRAAFKFDPEGSDVAEFRVWLSTNDRQWGETWLYRWTK